MTSGLARFLSLILVLVVTGPARADDLARLTDDARKTADSLLQLIRGELVRSFEGSGPLRAIITCKYSVPELTSNVSRTTGWKVSRVALKPRNPALGSADVWEQRALLNFEQAQARGDREPLEMSEIVSEPAGRFYRYARALTLLPLCMNCHGPSEQMSDAVKAQLNLEYPNDRAFGYKQGQVRGAVSIKRLLAP